MYCLPEVGNKVFFINIHLKTLSFHSPKVMYLVVPKQWLGESPLTCKHITSFSSTIKPLLLLEAKVICNTKETSINNAMQEK